MMVMMGTSVERELLISLLEVARHIRTHADRCARRHGMTWAQFVVLRRIEQQPGLAQNQLAAIAEVTPITATRLIDRVETLGLVRRDADPKDRRIWRLRMTPAAAPVLRDSKRYSAELDELLIERVDSTAMDAMIIGLRKMKNNLRSKTTSAEGGATPRRKRRGAKADR
jgi:DNA-binding MarR family transcriptional regulator